MQVTLLAVRRVIRMALTVGPQSYKKLLEKNEPEEKLSKLNQGVQQYMTMTRYILAEQRKSPESTGELSQLLYAIQTIVKSVACTVRRMGLGVLTGRIQTENKYGDVAQLQKYSHELFVQILSGSYTCCMIASEIVDEIILVDTERQGKYIVIFDPLDGKGKDPFNIFGSIFGIYRRPLGKVHEKGILMQGKELIAAGYALYGSATTLVLSMSGGGGVNGFVLDPSVGEFFLCDPNMKIPPTSEMYSINEGYTPHWDPAITEFIRLRKHPKQKKIYSCRYIGTLVADIHRILKYGGVFLYPVTKDHPAGKLKLIFKCNPLAFILERAGGIASTGKLRTLEVVPEKLFHKTPFYTGGKTDMSDLLQIISTHRNQGIKGQTKATFEK